VRKLIEAAHTEAWDVLTEYRDVLDVLAGELLEKETLHRAELEAIFADVKKRPRLTLFDEFGGRVPSDKPPIKTPGELAIERGEPWPVPAPEPAFKTAIAAASKAAAEEGSNGSNGNGAHVNGGYANGGPPNGGPQNGGPANGGPNGTQPNYGAPAGWHAPGWPPPGQYPQQGAWYPPQPPPPGWQPYPPPYQPYPQPGQHVPQGGSPPPTPQDDRDDRGHGDGPTTPPG
jgi:cell division protease FtsH